MKERGTTAIVESKTAQNHIEITCRGADVLPLEAIEEFQGSLKKRTKRDIERITKSILTYGFSFPFFVWQFNGRNFCLDGHGRIQALREMSSKGIPLPSFPVAYVDAADEQEAKQKLLRLNSQYGQMTLESVMEFAAGLDVAWDDLSLTTGRMTIIGKLPETLNDDELPAQPEPFSKLGDVYELSTGESPHRLICGDAQDPAAIAKVLQGKPADLFLTDPPYNVDYTGKTKSSMKIDNDKLDDSAFRELLDKSFTEAAANLRPGASFYIWHSDSEGFNFRNSCRNAGLTVRQCLIWNKQSMVMGRQDYQWKHEPCLYGWKDGAPHTWYSDRKQTTVIDFDKPTKNAVHPTMKPVDLFAYQIFNSTKPGDLVLDSFLGSGTTIIACEKLGRVAVGCESDPTYCDVIVSRFIAWAEANGRTPVVLRNGERFYAGGQFEVISEGAANHSQHNSDAAPAIAGER